MYCKLLLLISPFFFTGCKVSESSIIGKYIDRERDDTLNVMANKTYEFEERLSNGKNGWNTGNWDIKKNSVFFFNTTPLPVVGYKLRVIKLGESTEPLKLEFVINASEKKLHFTEVIVIDRNTPVNTAHTSPGSNKLEIKTFNFDSIAVKIPYFPFIGFKQNKFDKNGVYQVIIYPAERLYELDKVSYKYRNRSLINHSENMRYQKGASK